MFFGAKLFYWLGLCLLTAIVFMFVVLVRITTPRLKLESLSKLGWGPSFIIIITTLLCYFLGFFLG